MVLSNPFQFFKHWKGLNIKKGKKEYETVY